MNERTGYLTASDVYIANATLPADAPYAITGVSQTQFSLARHYGAIKYGGYRYTYIAEHDELVRDDVLKLAVSLRRLAKRQAANEAKARQGELL